MSKELLYFLIGMGGGFVVFFLIVSVTLFLLSKAMNKYSDYLNDRDT